MATYQKKTPDTETTVEASDIAAVLMVLGVAAAAVASTYIVTRNPSTLRALADAANSQGVKLLLNGRKVLPG